MSIFMEWTQINIWNAGAEYSDVFLPMMQLAPMHQVCKRE